MDEQTLQPPPFDPNARISDTTAAAPSMPRSSRAATPLPENIGPYRILSELGEGGMGTVYKAEQQNPHRLVALKVIKAGIVTDELFRRFEQEAEALGRLQHVGIAQVYEAGTADSGFGPQPYFAMEFIEGVRCWRMPPSSTWMCALASN
jgi:non-specific serine/threonine protein kinase/serine/threonine-protein kinase